MEIIRVEDLSFEYSAAEDAKTEAPAAKALDKVSFSLEKGEMLCICGPTGSGKTTLLKMLKKELTPAGKKEGRILLSGTDTDQLSERVSASKIGYVTQRPEQQIVMDKVWHELAFGLENLGIPGDSIRRRVAEIACFFGIESWFDKNTDELSGGQKQLLNLASVMVMQPEVLILDEPSAQLDPIAAAEFLASVLRLKRELALTVIIVEHRLEDVIPVSDKLLVLENGGVKAFGPVRECVRSLESDSLAVPAAVRLYKTLADLEGREGSTLKEGGKDNVAPGNSKTPDENIPLGIAEGRRFLENYLERKLLKRESTEKRENHGSKREAYGSMQAQEDWQNEHEYAESKHGGLVPALEYSDVFVRYSRDAKDALSGMNLTVYEGEIFCIMGGNGAGKSTAVSAAAGLIKPYSGKIKVFGKKLKDYRGPELYRNCVAMLPQDVQTVFVEDSIGGRHPYDLSGGEQQLAALEIVLATKPRLLLLDEPTKGLDVHTTAELAKRLKKLTLEGMTIVIVTHDVEFAAIVADRLALMFNGEITSCDERVRFFSDNYFYTTAANRMSRGLTDGALTVGEIAEKVRKMM